MGNSVGDCISKYYVGNTKFDGYGLFDSSNNEYTEESTAIFHDIENPLVLTVKEKSTSGDAYDIEVSVYMGHGIDNISYSGLSSDNVLESLGEPENKEAKGPYDWKYYRFVGYECNGTTITEDMTFADIDDLYNIEASWEEIPSGYIGLSGTNSGDSLVIKYNESVLDAINEAIDNGDITIYDYSSMGAGLLGWMYNGSYIDSSLLMSSSLVGQTFSAQYGLLENVQLTYKFPEGMEMDDIKINVADSSYILYTLRSQYSNIYASQPGDRCIINGYEVLGFRYDSFDGTSVQNTDTYANNGGKNTIYVNCNPATFSVNLTDNGSSWGSVNIQYGQVATYISGQDLDAIVAYRDGYTFLGWFTEEEGGTQITNTSVFTPSDSDIKNLNVKLYAHWEANSEGDEVKITYKLNNGLDDFVVTGLPGTNAATYTPNKSGYKFGAWYTDESLTQIYKGDVGTFGDSDLTLYAKYIAEDEVVIFIFEDNTSTEFVDYLIVKTGEDIPYPALTKEGKQIDGWYNYYNSTMAISQAPDYNIYVCPKWIDAGETSSYLLKVVYGNGQPNVTAYVVQGDEITCLFEKNPTKEMYIFDGWYLDAQFTKPLTRSNYYLMPDKDITLYAKWKSNKGELIGYVGNDLDDIVIDYEIGATASYEDLGAPLSVNKTFEGWYLDKACTIKATGSFVMKAGCVEVYAKWSEQPRTFTIKYNTGNNLGVDTVEDVNLATFNVLQDLTQITTNANGKKFLGWYTNSDYTDNFLYTNVERYLNEDDELVLYGLWVDENLGNDEIEWTLRIYDENNNLIETRTYHRGDTINNLPSPDIYGYTGEHWADIYNNLPVSNGDTWYFTRNVDVHPRPLGIAEIYVNVYFVDDENNTHFVNFGSGFWKYGDEFDFGVAEGTKNPYFEGYEAAYLSASINGEEVDISTIPFVEGQDLTFYIVNKASKYNVNFYVDNGVSPDSQKATYTEAVGELPTVSIPGKNFLGWYTSHGEDAELVTSATVLANPGDINLYARFKNDVPETTKHTITYKFNNGEADAVVEAYKGDRIKTYEPYKRGYTLIGYYLDEDLTQECDEDLSVMIGENITLYAKYSKNAYKVTFIGGEGSVLVKPQQQNSPKLRKLAGTEDTTTTIEIVDLDTVLSTVMPTASKGTDAFVGWYTESDDSGLKVNDSNTWTDVADENTAEITLYAQFAPEIDPTPEAATTRADINFKDDNSEVLPGEEFTIVITSQTTRTGTTWSSADVSIYSDFFDNYVTYVGTTVTLADGTLYNDINGTTFEKGTNPYSYHAAVSFNNIDESSKYDTANIITFNVTFRLNSNATNIYDTEVGFYTYPSSNKYVYANGVIDTKNDVSTNHTRSNQLVFTVGHEKNTISYMPGEHGVGTSFEEQKAVDQETFDGYDAYYISSNKFSRSGYTQIGWSTTDGGAVEYNFAQAYTGNDDLVLYPVWEANKHTITFVSNGGSSVASISARYNEAVSMPSNPTKSGYSFRGWYLDDGTFLNEFDATSMPNEDVTVYAKWARNLIELKDASDGLDAYEFITLNAREESYENGGESYVDTYYYRETYASVGIEHGEEEPGTRVVLGKVVAETNLKEFLRHFKNDIDTIRVTDVDGTVVFENGEVPSAVRGSLTSEAFMASDDYFLVATGVKVELVLEGEVKDTIYVSVLGDINGDGRISANDYDRLRDRIKTATVNDYDLEVILACYVYNDGSYERFLFSDEYAIERHVAKNNAKVAIVTYLSRNTFFQSPNQQTSNNQQGRKVTNNPIATTYTIEFVEDSDKKED